MKKIILCVFCVIILIGLVHKSDIADVLGFLDYEVYVHTKSLPTEDSIIEVASKADIKKIDNKNDIYGITFKKDGDNQEVLKIISKLSGEVIETNIFQGYTEYLVYSDKIKSFKGQQSSRFNVQIVLKGNNIIIGSPAILEGF